MTPDKILVIKLGALGDFIQALGPMAAIRKFHPGARITLLTTRPFENFARACGYFDEVWIDERPKWLDFRRWIMLARQLNRGGFTRIYDLQNNDRTFFYLRLLRRARRPEWVGAAPGASHRNVSAERISGHAFDGHVQTLALAGIKDVEIDTLPWMKASISSFPLRKPYVLLVPGSAPQHPGKRWPAERYGSLARTLSGSGCQPVILGTGTEETAAKIIMKECPEALDLTSKTSFEQIAVLARGASAAVGNDTGPMHLIAATGCPCLVLFSAHSNPVRHAPKGKDVHVIQKDKTADISLEDVLANLHARGNSPLRVSTLH